MPNDSQDQTGPTCPLSDRELRAVIAKHVSRVSRRVANGNTTAQEVALAAIAADRARISEAMLVEYQRGGEMPNALAIFDRACRAVDERTREGR